MRLILGVAVAGLLWCGSVVHSGEDWLSLPSVPPVSDGDGSLFGSSADSPMDKFYKQQEFEARKFYAESMNDLEKNYLQEQHASDMHYLQQSGASPSTLYHEENMHRENMMHNQLNHDSYMLRLESENPYAY